MRLALVAASSYEENGQVARIPNAELDVELFGSRLADADAGFDVHAFTAQRGLAESIDALIGSLGERPKELVFYFWGYALNSQERGPTLLLDGPKLSSFSLARLRRQLSECADAALVVIDATLAEGSFGEPLDAVRAMGSALSNGDSNISTLVAVRLPEQGSPQGPPPFTGLVQMILDAQTGSTTALTPETLFRAMQAEEVMFADIPAAGCFLGRTEFAVVPAAAPPSVAPAPLHEPGDIDEVTAPRIPAPAALPSETSVEPGAHHYPPPPPPILRAAPPPPPPPMPAPRPVLESLPELPASEAAVHCRQVLRDCESAGDHDGAYRAAQVLEVLGEADINESLLATTHRPEGLQAVRGALSYGDWQERLSRGCDDPLTSAVLRALGPALGRVGFQHARRFRHEVPLPDEARQDPEKSTTTLAKTLHWTSRLLCVPAADLFVLPELAGTLGLVPGPEQPRVACARALGSGFSLPQLVCLWARELSFARIEQCALCYFPDAEDLSHLLLAALAIGGATAMRAIDGEAKRLASGLKREVRGPALDELRAAAARFPMHEVSARAAEFVRSAELVAGRVALVACGDLELALAIEQRFPRAHSVTQPAERRADVLHFALSTELGQVRRALGVAVA